MVCEFCGESYGGTGGQEHNRWCFSCSEEGLAWAIRMAREDGGCRKVVPAAVRDGLAKDLGEAEIKLAEAKEDFADIEISRDQWKHAANGLQVELQSHKDGYKSVVAELSATVQLLRNTEGARDIVELRVVELNKQLLAVTAELADEKSKHDDFLGELCKWRKAFCDIRMMVDSRWQSLGE